MPEEVKLIEKRTANHIYESGYTDKPVIVKLVTKVGLPRFEREERALKLGQGYVPKLYHSGDVDYIFKGGKGFIMEKLDFNYKSIGIIELLLGALNSMWELYRRGVIVTPKLRNIGLSSGKVKWLDFNDDTTEELGYKDFHFVDYFRDGPLCFKNVVSSLEKYYRDKDIVIDNRFILRNKFIPMMYKSLINVHDPIAIPDLEKSPRTETEKKDPNYGKPAIPNRKCYDRFEMIKSIHLDGWWKNKKVIDIGSNSGWFPINFARLGADVVGYEIDQEKCEFSEMIAFIEGIDNVKFRSSSSLNHVKKVDLITLLSTFNRWVLSDEEKAIIGDLPIKEERQAILKRLWEKTDEMIIEIPNYWIKNALQGDFVPFMERNGAECRILGTSDNGRKLFYFWRVK